MVYFIIKYGKSIKVIKNGTQFFLMNYKLIWNNFKNPNKLDKVINVVLIKVKLFVIELMYDYTYFLK